MAVGAINKADYEWVTHAPEFLSAGGTKRQGFTNLKPGI
jgi:hypothetical protein